MSSTHAEVLMSGTPPRLLPALSDWRREAMRTNLWLVPSIETAAAAALFAVTVTMDRSVYGGSLALPGWVNNGSADAARTILTAIAAAVVTVVSLVFSITIVALTLASSQFGPRMLRNFIRDRTTQLTLGTYVATFVYAVLALASIGPGGHGDFVPHLSITVALGLLLIDVGVLIIFIHRIAVSIQLPQVIAGIADELAEAIDLEFRPAGKAVVPLQSGLSVTELALRMAESGAPVPAARSGYLQFAAHDALGDLATRHDAVIALAHRPGHFVVEGLPFATVWPPQAAAAVAAAVARGNFTGPNRTLAQDLTFAIDQLVEIALRALSPAVNDTFTALTCIDWLGDGLGRLSAKWQAPEPRRDRQGHIRVIPAETRYERFVQRAFDKVRQAATGMPAVLIRQLDALARIGAKVPAGLDRGVLIEQAELIRRAAESSVSEPADLADVLRRYDLAIAVLKSDPGEGSGTSK
ncbi:MAG TPA: DUF2254 domain-containing protein [Sporichthyaceae bacterium]|jgi:uncharacterized membrane protein|nr:DUF2254 domain-containing protein [Sporichthyaceae bacterium]